MLSISYIYILYLFYNTIIENYKNHLYIRSSIYKKPINTIKNSNTTNLLINPQNTLKYKSSELYFGLNDKDYFLKLKNKIFNYNINNYFNNINNTIYTINIYNNIFTLSKLKEIFINQHPIPSLLNEQSNICFLNTAIHILYSFKCSKYFLENIFHKNSLEYEIKIIFLKLTLYQNINHNMYINYKNIYYKMNKDLEKENGGTTIFFLIEVLSSIFKRKNNKIEDNKRLFRAFNTKLKVEYCPKEMIYRNIYIKYNNIPIFFKVFNYSYIKAILYTEIELYKEPAYIIPFSFYTPKAPKLIEEIWKSIIQPIKYKKYTYILKSITLLIKYKDYNHSCALIRRKDKWYNVDDGYKKIFKNEFSENKIIKDLFYELI